MCHCLKKVVFWINIYQVSLGYRFTSDDGTAVYLGAWVKHLRQAWIHAGLRKKKWSPDSIKLTSTRVQQLEEIGLSWNGAKFMRGGYRKWTMKNYQQHYEARQLREAAAGGNLFEVVDGGEEVDREEEVEETGDEIVSEVMKLIESDSRMLLVVAMGMKNEEGDVMPEYSNEIFARAGMSRELKPTDTYYQDEIRRRKANGRAVDDDFESTWTEENYRTELLKSGGYKEEDDCFTIADVGFIESRIAGLLGETEKRMAV